jgi:hypothetical protein
VCVVAVQVVLVRAFVPPEGKGLISFLARHFSILRSNRASMSNAKARQLTRQLTADSRARDVPPTPDTPQGAKNKTGSAVWDVQVLTPKHTDKVIMGAAERLAVQKELVQHAVLSRTRMGQKTQNAHTTAAARRRSSTWFKLLPARR